MLTVMVTVTVTVMVMVMVLDAEIWRSKPGSNQTGWQVKHQSCPKFLWANTQSLLILFVKGVDFYRHLYQFVLFVKSWPV